MLLVAAGRCWGRGAGRCTAAAGAWCSCSLVHLLKHVFVLALLAGLASQHGQVSVSGGCHILAIWSVEHHMQPQHVRAKLRIAQHHNRRAAAAW